MFTPDLHNILVLGVLALFLYLAYKVGVFVLKISIGLLVICLVAGLLPEIWAALTGWIQESFSVSWNQCSNELRLVDLSKI